MRIIEKILNVVLQIVTAILILLSFIAIISIHLNFNNNSMYYFSFTINGFNNYITAYGYYTVLFSATLATLTAYFGLLRIKAATDANLDRIRQDRFSEWRTVTDSIAVDIERTDPVMRRLFTRVRLNLFNQLYELNFDINNNGVLTTIFQTNFRAIVNNFETHNRRHLDMGGVYPNAEYSYSFDSFRFLVIGCINDFYPEIEEDLRTLYLATLPADRRIDVEEYRAAQNNYRPNIY